VKPKQNFSALKDQETVTRLLDVAVHYERQKHLPEPEFHNLMHAHYSALRTLGGSPLGLPHLEAPPLTGINRNKPALFGIKSLKNFWEHALPRHLLSSILFPRSGVCASSWFESPPKHFNSVTRGLASQRLPIPEHN